MCWTSLRYYSCSVDLKSCVQNHFVSCLRTVLRYFSARCHMLSYFDICSVASDSQNAVLDLWQLKKLSAERMFYI